MGSLFSKEHHCLSSSRRDGGLVYRVDVAPGPKKVVIEGHEKMGEKHVGDPGNPLVPIVKQYLPV